MNKAEVLSRVSRQSGVNLDDCQKVLDAFEAVLSDELANSIRAWLAMDNSLMNCIIDLPK